MQLTSALLLIFSLSLSARTMSQTITLSGTDLTASEVFRAVERQTGYSVLAKDETLRKIGKITVDVRDIPIGHFMAMILKGKPVDFTIRGETIFLRQRNGPPGPPSEEQLPLITVRGRVVNEKGEGVSASVIIKESGRGTTTDDHGNFEIQEVDDKATLIVSGITIETRSVVVNGRQELIIRVTTKISNEQEVVINGGYYKVADRKRTGNISRVEAKDINRQPVTSPLMALQGRMAGVDITPVTGMPGTYTRIQIRGTNSINAGSYPLYVIDGVPIDSKPVRTNSSSSNMVGDGFDPLSTLHPSNIASIEVLKDADATSIYGSRGANGVVLISTKRGNASGRTAFEFNGYLGAGRISSKPDLMNTTQYLAMRREAFANDHAEPEWYDFDMFWDSTRNTDWVKELLGNTAQVTDVSGGLTGGNAQLNYRLSAGYHRETLVTPGDFNYQRVSGSFALNHQSANGRLKSQFTLNYGSEFSKQFDDAGDLVQKAVSLPPNAPALYDAKGDLNFENNTFINPLLNIRRSHRVVNDGLTINTETRYKLFDGLELRVILGYNDLTGTERLRNPIASNAPLYQKYYTAGGSNANNKRKSWNVEPMLTYTARLGGGSLTVLAGGTLQQASMVNTGVGWSGARTDLVIEDPNAGTGMSQYGNDNIHYRYASAFARVGYDLKGKYIVNLNGRRDGSSRFGPGNKWANFGSVGAAWIFSEESFVRDHLSFLSYGKLRASFGTTGNDQIGDYQFYDFFSLHYTPYGPYMATYSSALFNPDYRWELTKKLEIAMDLSFLNNRAGIELSWYRNRSTGQLMGNALPYTTGFQQIFANFPATVQNSGVELVLRATPVQVRNFKWDMSLNISLPKNKLVAYPGLESSPYAESYQIGQPLSLSKFYPAASVDPATGLYVMEDVNHDGLLTHLDRTELFHRDPKFFGGWQNNFQYKNFQLNFLFQFTKRNIVNFNYAMPGTANNQWVSVLDRWQKPGDQTTVQRFSQVYFGDAKTQYDLSRGSITNTYTGSYLRLKTATLSYRLPAAVLGNGNRSLSIYLQGQNLFTISNNILLDPETGLSLPPLRMITFGLQLTI